MRRIAVLLVVVVVILFRGLVWVMNNFKKLFLNAEPGDFSCIAYLSSMLFLIIFGEVMLQLIKMNWECVFILIKFAHSTDVWNSLSSAYTTMWSLWKLFHPVKQWLHIEMIFTTLLTIYNCSEPINSALFFKSEVK